MEATVKMIDIRLKRMKRVRIRERTSMVNKLLEGADDDDGLFVEGPSKNS